MECCFLTDEHKTIRDQDYETSVIPEWARIAPSVSCAQHVTPFSPRFAINDEPWIEVFRVH